MIGGIIILSIFLVALVSMMVVSQQYDAYQGTVNQMAQKDIDRYSERLQAVYPGLGTQNQILTTCGGGGTSCYNYTLLVSNLGIGAQIARIYINSTSGPCTGLCVLNAAAKTSTAPNRFLDSDQYVNPGEFFHQTQMWIPAVGTPTQLPTQCTVGGNTLKYGCNTITIVTSRGRVFSFLYPFPPAGQTQGGGEGGGTGIYIGPLVITFQKSLFEYSTKNQVNPPVPIGGPNGYWTIPTGKMVFYVQIQTDVGVPSDVYLTAQSVFEIVPFNSPAGAQFFFIIAPISKTYCTQAFSTAVNCNLVDSSTNPVYPTTGNTGNPEGGNIVKYKACPVSPQNYNDANCLATYGKRYVIPKPTTSGQRGPPVIVAFAATAPSGDNPQNNNAGDGTSVTSFLGISYVYDSGVPGSQYVYGVTLPFISICVSTNAPTPSCNG
jgi:hypothetical protein